MGADPPEETPDDAAFRPDDLDFTDDERVAELQEGRYVVSTDDGAPAVDEDETDGDPGGAPVGRRPDSDPEEVDVETARKRIAAHVRRVDADHGFAATAAVDGEVSQQEAFSDDIATVFRSLLVWYARTVDDDTPTDEVLGILLLAADVPVRYPANALAELVAAHGLGPEDSIGDLLAAVREDDGVRLPRPDRDPRRSER